MNKTALAMLIITALLLFYSLFTGGFSLVGEAFLVTGTTLINITPILIVAFLIAGLISTLLSKKMASKWLGKEAGWKGPFFGALMGALVPGGPFFFYPLMATLLTSGATLGTMLSFVASKSLWNVARIPIEIAFVGIELTVIRFLVTFGIPVLVGSTVNTLLPHYTDKVREDIRILQLKDPKNNKEGQHD